jgi:hypothetical protein
MTWRGGGRKYEWVPQVGGHADRCLLSVRSAQVSAYRDLWHPHSSN